ncbi:MAG: polysaccharide export protein [Desulfovibrionaceae bacterium]|nr:polysaccharide export protein [Desulfovibrionaceae bacterium]
MKACFLAALLAALLTALPVRAADAPAPFAANLFQGNFAGKDAGDTAALIPGDRVLVRLWGGGLQVDDTMTVDSAGNIALPELGSVPVAGIARDTLVDSLKSKLAAAGHPDSQVYVAPLDGRSVSVFVTGGVRKPGRYSGTPTDPVLGFLDRAGGIDAARGSYRNITLVRNGAVVERFDLYPFARKGTLPQARLRDGDTLVVGERGPCVTASGAVRTPARFEFPQGKATGAALLELAEPESRASHAALRGTRNGAPYSTYLPVQELRGLTLADGDSVNFLADKTGDTIMISVEGAARGASRFPVRRGARLRDVLAYVAVEPDRANLEALHLKRASVAARQKRAIADSLRRLEEASLTASSGSTEESSIRAKEAEMIARFVERAKSAEPEGIVVLEGEANIALEDGDVIVIPEKSDVVLVSGEVMVPQALVWSGKKDLSDYVRGAGGYTARADEGNVLILRQNGAVARDGDDILPGDQVLVLPRVQSKSMQIIKDISQVLMQVTVSTRMVLGLPSL